MTSNLNHKSINQLARQLRNNPTPSEKFLWTYLRKRQLNGLRFLRQFPIVHEESNTTKFFYIADFYCSKLKLIIELDGPIHLSRKEYDANRDFVLSSLGFRICRILNDDLEEIDKVLNKITRFILYTDP